MINIGKTFLYVLGTSKSPLLLFFLLLTLRAA